jgi:hypothetical protein
MRRHDSSVGTTRHVARLPWRCCARSRPRVSPERAT